MICPDCQAGTRVHKVEGIRRLRECLGCRKRFRTEEILLHEVGAVTKERLLSFLAERKRWMSYRGLAHYFAVSESTVQVYIKKLEGEGLVVCQIQNGSKVWQIANKPAPVAVPVRKRNAGDRTEKPRQKEPAAKPRTKVPAPVQPQSWFSSIT